MVVERKVVVLPRILKDDEHLEIKSITHIYNLLLSRHRFTDEK